MRASSESWNQNSFNLIDIDTLDRLDNASADFPQAKQRSQASNQLGNWFQALVNRLGAAPEPKVWQSRDRAGRLMWNVHDPISNDAATFASESEVRAWLENRYRH